MSDGTKSGEGNEKKGGEGNPDIAKVMERLAELENSNKRLVEESKTNKTRAQEAEKKLEDAEKEKVEKSGNLEAKLEFEKKERERIAAENKKLKTTTLKNNVKSAVSKFANDVHDMDDFLNQPAFKDIIDKGIDPDTLTLSEDAAKTYVNKVREAKPFLFKNLKQEAVDTKKPNGTQVNGDKEVKKGEHLGLLKDAMKNW